MSGPARLLPWICWIRISRNGAGWTGGLKSFHCFYVNPHKLERSQQATEHEVRLLPRISLRETENQNTEKWIQSLPQGTCGKENQSTLSHGGIRQPWERAVGRSKGSLSHTEAKLVHNFYLAWRVCMCVCVVFMWVQVCPRWGQRWLLVHLIFWEISHSLGEWDSAGFISGAYPVTGIHCPASPQGPPTCLSPSAGLTSSTLSFYTSAGDLDSSLCAGTASALSRVPSPVPTRLLFSRFKTRPPSSPVWTC